MNTNVADLLNFTLNESSASPTSHTGIKLDRNLLIPENIVDGRKSLDNNPFDKVSKQVETFSSDPFEFVAAQSKNFKAVISCIRTGNLIDFGGDKENNNHDGNLSPTKSKEKTKISSPSPKKVTRRSKSSSNDTGSGKKRDSLLRLSLANASKSAMINNDVVEENVMGEKWMNMEMPDDSFNDLMRQEIVLVDSDVSLNDYDAELNIPILKELDEIKKVEKTPSVEDVRNNEALTVNDTHTSIIDRAIAKLNEIKLAKTRETNMEDTMSKLKEMVSKVDGNGTGEASQLLEQLCAALNKKQGDSNKNLLEPPPVMIRQGTFEIDKTAESIDTSDNTESTSPQLQTVIDKLSEVLGNVNMNVIQSSPDNPQVTNPVVVVVVNPDAGFGMSDTVTLNQHHTFNTPQPKSRTRRSQSFSSAARPNTVAPNPVRRESIAHGTPQRNVQPTRRSFSFSSPAPRNVITKRPSILPSNSQNKVAPLKAVQTAPSASLSKPGPTNNRLSFIDKLKPKIGFLSTTQKKPAAKAVPLKVTGPLKVIHRQKSPDSSMRSVSGSIRQTPQAQSTPMSRIATPQKPTRVSFLTPNRPTPSASTLTVPKQPTIKRRSSFNDKDKPSTSANLKPKPNLIRPSTGGLLTQRKFPMNKGTTSSVTAANTRPTVTQQTLKLKLKK